MVPALGIDSVKGPVLPLRILTAILEICTVLLAWLMLPELTVAEAEQLKVPMLWMLLELLPHPIRVSKAAITVNIFKLTFIFSLLPLLLTNSSAKLPPNCATAGPKLS